jgi:hypothetical protein
MFWNIDYIVLLIAKRCGREISRDRVYRMLQSWIKACIRHDPEAVVPALGVEPVYAFEDRIHKDMPDIRLVRELFGVQWSTHQVLRPYGVAPHAAEIHMTPQIKFALVCDSLTC